MIPLSDRTRQIIHLRFFGKCRETVTQLLENQCADSLPFQSPATPDSLERIRFAALKLAGKDVVKLKDVVRLAQIDWRDLLVNAGFELTLDAHERWVESILKNP